MNDRKQDLGKIVKVEQAWCDNFNKLIGPFEAKYEESKAHTNSETGPLTVPQLRSCSSSGFAWRLWAARQSQGEAQALGAQPPPLVLERAISKVAYFTAFDPPGGGQGLLRLRKDKVQRQPADAHRRLRLPPRLQAVVRRVLTRVPRGLCQRPCGIGLCSSLYMYLFNIHEPFQGVVVSCFFPRARYNLKSLSLHV